MDIAHDNHSFIDRTETNPLTRTNFIHDCFRCISRLTTHHRLLFFRLSRSPGKNLYRPIFYSHQRYDFRQYALGQRYRSQFVLRLSKQRTTIIPLSVGERRISQRSPNPFMREALIKSFNPTIASMAVMGLIALPGTMTGQILGGSSPSVAIKYQIMLMITIFASSLISVLLTLWISRKKTFDKYGMTKF